MTIDKESKGHSDSLSSDGGMRNLSMTRSLSILLADIIDYAGLFPPSGLEMSAAVNNYARYVEGEHAWMLGRFIIPATRLTEFHQAAEEVLPRDATTGPWRLSALIGSDIDGEIKSVLRFNELYRDTAKRGAAVFYALLFKTSHPNGV